MKISITALYGCGECVAPLEWDIKGIPRPYRLYYILGGNAYYQASGEKVKLECGSFYLFPSSMPFNASQDPCDRLNHLYFDFMMSPSVISSEPLSCRTSDHPLLPALLNLMEKSVVAYCYEGKSELRDTVISSLEAFLSLFLEIAKPKRLLSPDICAALEYIEQNYMEEISVGSISKLVFLDEGYFIKKFKRELGVTPYSFIKNLRMSVARELRSGGESLKDAAISAGFKYPSSYCRAISRQRKKTP